MKKTINFLSLIVTAVLLFGNFTYGEEWAGRVSSDGNYGYIKDDTTPYDVTIPFDPEYSNSSEVQDGEKQGEKGTEEEKCKNECCGIKLNTNFPIIGNCIGTSKDSKTNPTTAFPKMVGALTKIIMSLILVVCFIFIIVAGIMWAGSGEDNSQVTKAKGILKKVAIVILLLGFSGAILRLINPNFFG